MFNLFMLRGLKLDPERREFLWGKLRENAYAYGDYCKKTDKDSRTHWKDFLAYYNDPAVTK